MSYISGEVTCVRFGERDGVFQLIAMSYICDEVTCVRFRERKRER